MPLGSGGGGPRGRPPPPPPPAVGAQPSRRGHSHPTPLPTLVSNPATLTLLAPLPPRAGAATLPLTPGSLRQAGPARAPSISGVDWGEFYAGPEGSDCRY